MIRAASQAPIPLEDAHAKIEKILARPEFHPRENPLQRWLSELFRKIVDAISEFFGISASASGTLLQTCGYVAIGLVLVLLIREVVRRGRASEPDEKRDADPETIRRQRVLDLRLRAREADRAGDTLLALRLYFIALVVGLGEKGDLAYRDAWTNRELLERGEPRPAVLAVLRPLIPVLDAQSFGHAPAESADVERLARLCDQHLGALPT